MAKGTVHECERAIMRDGRSGLRIFRLTHGPCIATNLYFEMCSFTEDDSYVVFRSQRVAGRGAPMDLYRARTDGTELVQLTDCDDISGVVFCPRTRSFYFVTKGEIHKLDILSLNEEVVAVAPSEQAVWPGSLGGVDRRGLAYFSNCRLAENRCVLYKVDLATGKVDGIFESEQQNHIHVDPSGRIVSFGNFTGTQGLPYLVDADGRNPRPYPFRQFAHCTWFGETGRIQGTLVPPGHALVTIGEGDKEPTQLTSGRYYWHSSASPDAQWIISDTNWPQEGLYLLHVPSGTVTYVCDTKSSCSHPQWTHPHPSLSPNVKYVLYNSDMTGVGQVYLAELTPEFIEQASKGYACKHPLL